MKNPAYRKEIVNHSKDSFNDNIDVLLNRGVKPFVIHVYCAFHSGLRLTYFGFGVFRYYYAKHQIFKHLGIDISRNIYFVERGVENNQLDFNF